MLEQTGQDATSPWHAGELAMQRSVGVAERMDGPGRNFVRKAMPEQHRAFFPMLPFVVLGAVDAKGDVWATVRAERPGFMASPEPEVLEVRLPRDAADPADAGMEDGDAIAMLGIQLETRRRNRLNGVIRRTDAGAFQVRVGQSFGNCPQYIQLRSSAFVRDPDMPTAMSPVHAGQLDDRARWMIERADTFFVASYVDRDNGERQVDVSHRDYYHVFLGLLGVDDVHGAGSVVRLPCRRRRYADHSRFPRQSVLQHARQFPRQSEGGAGLHGFRNRRHAADDGQGRGAAGFA